MTTKRALVHWYYRNRTALPGLQFLLEQGYQVIGMIRPLEHQSTSSVSAIFQDRRHPRPVAPICSTSRHLADRHLICPPPTTGV